MRHQVHGGHTGGQLAWLQRHTSHHSTCSGCWVVQVCVLNGRVCVMMVGKSDRRTAVALTGARKHSSKQHRTHKHSQNTYTYTPTNKQTRTWWQCSWCDLHHVHPSSTRGWWCHVHQLTRDCTWGQTWFGGWAGGLCEARCEHHEV